MLMHALNFKNKQTCVLLGLAAQEAMSVNLGLFPRIAYE